MTLILCQTMLSMLYIKIVKKGSGSVLISEEWIIIPDNIPICKYYPKNIANSLHGKRVREFCRADDGTLWIGTEDGGLNHFNPKTKEFHFLSQVPDLLISMVCAWMAVICGWEHSLKDFG